MPLTEDDDVTRARELPPPPAADNVQLFREILLLPLRLDDKNDKQALRRFMKGNLGGAWKKSGNGRSRVKPSRLWPAVGMRGIERADEDGFTRDYERRWDYAEASYFHPYVQRFLYGDIGLDGIDAAVQVWERVGLEKLRLRMDYDSGCSGRVAAFPEATGFEIELEVERVELNLASEPGLIVGLVELAASGTSPIRRYAGATEIAGPHRLSMPEILAVKDGLRRIYPPFFKQLSGTGSKAAADWDRSLFPTSVSFTGKDATFGGPLAAAAAHDMIDSMARGNQTPVAPWWRALFAPLAIEVAETGKPLLRQVVDDRMPTLSFVAVREPSAISRNELVRLCFCDKPGQELPYAEAFLENFERDHCYDRFVDDGTRTMASSYSLVMVAKTYADVDRQSGAFDFALDVLQEHMRRHYLKMVMIAHLQRAGLLAYSNWISGAMRAGGTLRNRSYRAAISDLRRSLVEFSQISWFSNISNQEQARELFALLQRHLGNEALHEEVALELDRARDVLTEIDTERNAEAAMAFNAFAVLAVVTGIPLGFLEVFGVDNVWGEHGREVAHHFMAAAMVMASVLVIWLWRLQTGGPVHAASPGRRREQPRQPFGAGKLATYAAALLGFAGALYNFCRGLGVI